MPALAESDGVLRVKLIRKQAEAYSPESARLVSLGVVSRRKTERRGDRTRGGRFMQWTVFLWGSFSTHYARHAGSKTGTSCPTPINGAITRVLGIRLLRMTKEP